MTCTICNRPINTGEAYIDLGPEGKAHNTCSPKKSGQASLMAEDDELPIDHVTEEYPD